MSKTINVDIQNSFGIIEFKHSFEFDDTSNFYGLYAQNGTMKSSFAKTLQSYHNGDIISDKLFNVPGTCTISDLEPQNILSFPSFSGHAEICDEARSLVANDQAKEEYDQALAGVMQMYNVFTAKLAEATKINQADAIIEALYRDFVPEDRVGRRLLYRQ